MTYEAALAEIDTCIGNAIDSCMKLLLSKGATLDEIESTMAWYTQELATFKQDAIVKLDAALEGWVTSESQSLH
jgi:hypothetical protein